MQIPAGTKYGANATYTCNTGYKLVGGSTRTCQADGTWGFLTPTCIGEKGTLTLFYFFQKVSHLASLLVCMQIKVCFFQKHVNANTR